MHVHQECTISSTNNQSIWVWIHNHLNPAMALSTIPRASALSNTKESAATVGPHDNRNRLWSNRSSVTERNIPSSLAERWISTCEGVWGVRVCIVWGCDDMGIIGFDSLRAFKWLPYVRSHLKTVIVWLRPFAAHLEVWPCWVRESDCQIRSYLSEFKLENKSLMSQRKRRTKFLDLVSNYRVASVVFLGSV